MIFLLKYWKQIAAGLLVVLSFLGGMYLENLRWEVSQAKERELVLEAVGVLQNVLAKKGEEYEAWKVESDKKLRTRTIQRKEYAKTDDAYTCKLPISGVQLHNQGIEAANAKQY